MKNYLDFKRQLEEKHLTAAELKKREEIARAIEKKNPDMPKDQKMAIATAQAKKVAEEYEKLVAEMKELGFDEKALEEGAMDDILGGLGKYVPKVGAALKGAKQGVADVVQSAKNKASDLLGLGAKETKASPKISADPTDAGKTTSKAADDPMGVQGPKVTQPYKDTDAAAAFTKSELDRIAKKAANDTRPPSGTNAPAKAADDIKPPAPAPKVTQPRDSAGRFTAKTATKAADDIKPPPGTNAPLKAADDIKPPPGTNKSLSTPAKVGLGLAGAAATGAALKAVDSMTNDKASSKEAPTPSDDRASKEPSASAEAPKASSDDNKTFGQAFAAARKAAAEKGAESTGRFTFKGKEYQTNVKGEKYVSRSKQTAVGESFETLPAGSIDEAILMSLTQVKK